MKAKDDFGEIEFMHFPDSGKTVTPERAIEELANQRSLYGSSVSQITPCGIHKILIDGEWHKVDESGPSK